jgi:hypothetical protein
MLISVFSGKIKKKTRKNPSQTQKHLAISGDSSPRGRWRELDLSPPGLYVGMLCCVCSFLGEVTQRQGSEGNPGLAVHLPLAVNTLPSHVKAGVLGMLCGFVSPFSAWTSFKKKRFILGHSSEG